MNRLFIGNIYKNFQRELIDFWYVTVITITNYKFLIYTHDAECINKN